MDRFIISRIIDPSDTKIEFKNITFDCKTIKDASGNVFVRQKIGEWMSIKGNIYRCSECGTKIAFSGITIAKYCDNCGAKMGGEEE